MNRKNIVVKQNDIKDCGICCLESIIKYYNGFIPLETLRMDTKTTNNGTTAYNLIKTAQKYGFNAQGKKNMTLEDQDLILPAIAHVVTKKGFNHFVVIYKVTKTDVHLMDPAKGYLKMKKDEFQKQWTNIILIFKPYNKIPLYKLKNSLKNLFINILSKEKNLIRKILITNIILTIISIIISYYFKIVITSIEENFLNSTLFIIFIFFILNIFKIYFNYLKNNLTIYLNKNIDLRIIPDFISHIIKLPLNVIKSRSSGEIITRIQELNNIKDLFSEIFITIILDLFLSICSIFFLYQTSSQLFLILCIMAILYVIVGFITNPLVFRKINDNIDLETEFNSEVTENIDALESIKNLNNIPNTIERLDQKYTAYEKNSFIYSKFLNSLYTIKSAINDLGLFIISSFGIYLITKNKLDLLSLITFNTLLTYFIDPIENSINLLPKFQLVKLSFNKISEFLNLESEELGQVEKFSKGDIVFDKVSYTYNDYNNIINNLSLTIKANSHTIISGATGMGKSTIVKMINRYIDDYKGNITINNINIKDYSLNTLRKNILYISQREKIFNDTIYNNIVLNKKVTKDELNEVLKITKVDEIINKKSMRLDSILYDSGSNLSGGERQRIILARSLLRKPEIYILDESLSEVDKKTEEKILKNIDSYLHDKTIIYISHTETKAFNNIIEMDKFI